LTISTDVQKHQAGVVLREPIVGQTPFREASGPEILNQDVSTAHKPAKDFLPRGLFDIHGREKLIARRDAPPKRLAILEASYTPYFVPSGMFDLDDGGAKVSHQGTNQGSGKQHSNVDHCQTR
jgi:hypothetical protein